MGILSFLSQNNYHSRSKFTGQDGPNEVSKTTNKTNSMESLLTPSTAPTLRSNATEVVLMVKGSLS
jgi:hypothetical protein